MNKLNQLTKAIQEANPEIMKLEFGCRIEYKKFGRIKTAKLLKTERAKYGEDLYLSSGVKIHIEKIRIIGRDITLFDVYDTVEKITYREVKDIKFRHTKFGEVKTFKDDEIKILHMWKRHKPLHQQEQETIDFLHDLIY